MIINTPRGSLDRLANDNDLAKFRFEGVMYNQLKSYFRQVADDFEVVYRATGQILDLTINELISILKYNYRATGAYFREDIRRRLVNTEKAYESDLIELINARASIEADLQNKLIQTYNDRAFKQSLYIQHTTKDIMEKEVFNITLEAANNGQQLTNTQIAGVAKERILVANSHRLETIAQTEIQLGSESAKQYEAELLNNTLSNGQSSLFVEKIWISMGDNKVRSTHKMADGQTQRVDVPFIVGGQMLMFPGDGSRGASPSEIINCRCLSLAI